LPLLKGHEEDKRKREMNKHTKEKGREEYDEG
jgi:hypothetical protein